MIKYFNDNKWFLLIVGLLICLITQQSLNYKKTKKHISSKLQHNLHTTNYVLLDDKTAIVTNSENKFAMFVDPNDGYVSQVIRQNGSHYQPEIADTLRQIIKSGDVVVHFGGHIGSFEHLIAKQVGKSGKVFTFEPNPTSFRILKKNVLLHGNDDVITTFNSGVWSENTTKMFCAGNENTGGAAVSLYGKSDTANCFEVDLVKPDDVLSSMIDHIDLLFLDIEGSEIQAIRGISNILSKSPDCIILMEFSKVSFAHRGFDEKALLKFFQEQYNAKKRIFKIVRGEGQNITTFQEISTVSKLVEHKHCDIIILPGTKKPQKVLKFLKAPL